MYRFLSWMAIGIAASQPVGLREQFGTMTKPLHPGAAARAGLMSALLASKGFTSSVRALEAPRGFVQVVSDKRAWSEVTDKLGERFEKEEDRLFGEEGFEKTVEQVAGIERQLGIGDLAAFTPK